MKYFLNVLIAYIFLVVLTLPVTIELFSSYGTLIAFALVPIPLLWFILDSEVTHNSMDKFLKE